MTSRGVSTEAIRAPDEGGPRARGDAPRQPSLRGERLLIVGKHSYIGHAFGAHAVRCGAKVTALSSGDCNFLDRDEVVRCFASLGDGLYTILFLAVINKPAAESFDAFVDNVRMVHHLVEGCRQRPARSVIYFSSVDVYGRTPATPITETSPVQPDGWYALAKVTGEWLLRSVGQLSCPVTVLRLPGVYGRSAQDHSVIGRIVEEIRRHRSVRLSGTGKALRDYVSLDDLCHLLEALIPLRHDGILNVATGCSLPLREIVQRIKRVLQVDFEIRQDETNAVRDFDLEFDITKLRHLVPAWAFRNLEDGLRSYRA